MSKELKEVLAEERVVIGVLGAIGSGKSTLSTKLSESLGLPKIEENFPENPFLKKFYDSPSKFSFRSQVWFLKSTVDQMIQVKSEFKNKSIIYDPANEMNLIYAKTHLDLGWMNKDEFNLYKELYKILTQKSETTAPDLLLWLSTSERVLGERIKKRARPYELNILKKYPDYLPQLNANVISFAQKSDRNLIYVDSEQDYENPKILIGVVEKIKRSIVGIT